MNLQEFITRNKGRFGFSSAEPVCYITYKKRDESLGHSQIYEIPTTYKEAMAKTYSLCNRWNAILGVSCPVISTHDGNSSTDGKKLWVSFESFNDEKFPSYDMTERVDVTLGNDIHEALHILYTDFDIRQQAITRHRTSHGGFAGQLFNSIHNVIEDQRIEMCGILETGGIAKFLESMKHHSFFLLAKTFREERKKRRKEALAAATDDESREEAELSAEYSELFMQMLYVIRYPAKENLDMGFIKKYQKFFDELVKILTDEPKTNEDAIEASKKVFILFLQHCEYIKRKKKGDFLNEDSIGDLPFEKALEDIDEALKGLLERVLYATNIGDDDGGHRIADSNEFAERFIFTELEDKDMHAPASNTRFTYAKTNSHVYRKVLGEVGAAATAMRTNLFLKREDRTRISYNRKFGYMDDNELYRVKLGETNIYTQKENRNNAKPVNVIMLYDLSGSMRGSRITSARQSAIMINSALQSVPKINVFQYGHSTNIEGHSGCSIVIFEEPGFNNPETLGSISHHYSNEDGTAIYTVANRVMSLHSNDPAIMIVISDGHPACSFYSRSRNGIKHTRECVNKVQDTFHIPVIQVAIDSSVPSERMFDFHVKFTNLATLATDLSQMIETAIECYS